MKKDFVDKYVDEMIREEIVVSKVIFENNKFFIERERIKQRWIASGLIGENYTDDDMDSLTEKIYGKARPDLFRNR